MMKQLVMTASCSLFLLSGCAELAKQAGIDPTNLERASALGMNGVRAISEDAKPKEKIDPERSPVVEDESVRSYSTKLFEKIEGMTELKYKKLKILDIDSQYSRRG